MTDASLLVGIGLPHGLLGIGGRRLPRSAMRRAFGFLLVCLAVVVLSEARL